MLSNIISISVCSFLLSCFGGNVESKSIKKQSESKDSLGAGVSRDTTKPVVFKKSEYPYTRIISQSAVKVLSAQKGYDTVSRFFKQYSERCDKWNLSNQNILKIIKSSKEIDGQDFHHFYDVLPCYYSGEINVDGKVIPFQTNAGAFTTLFLKDTSIYLGYERSDFKKYFLVGPASQ